MKLTLPTDSAERKEYSLSRGCYAYFPAALAGVARHSFKAGAKHTEGILEHRRWLSDDHEDCIERHMMDLRDMLAQVDRGCSMEPYDFQAALLNEANALAWRALALSQLLHEKYGGAPLAPAARLEPLSNPPMAYANPPQHPWASLELGAMRPADELFPLDP